MSNSLDPDQARRIVGPDLGPCLPRLSADDTCRQRVKEMFLLSFSFHGVKFFACWVFLHDFCRLQIFFQN